jgi:hypothetical protein
MDNPRILVCTTFANRHWNEHARAMVESMHRHWPQNVGLVVTLDDALLQPEISKIIGVRGGAIGSFAIDERYQEFKAKYAAKDHPTDYRHQFFRFAHKIFALHDACDLATLSDTAADYVIWLDADVITEKDITPEALLSWLPREGEAASYLGRKDWHHSECGFMAFNIREFGARFIEGMLNRYYLSGGALDEKEQHDSWLFDVMRTNSEFWKGRPFRNLTEGKPGMDIFAASPLAEYMTHYKGPEAKDALASRPLRDGEWREISGPNPIPVLPMNQPLNVQVKNCVEHDVICRNVSANLAIFDQWLEPCAPDDEEVVFVSGGPLLDISRVQHYARKGRRIVCVKHALQRLLDAGVVPWACVLLDPRIHVEDFVAKPDTRIRWFVASMVDPKVTQKLLAAGCRVWGYHAAVGAGEDQYVAKGTPYIAFGSASATRGLFVMELLGFRKFLLMGYDLCHDAEEVDLNATLADGSKKYIEVPLTHQSWGGVTVDRTFITEGQLLAQAQEVEQIASQKMLEIRAEGDGIVPWLLYHKGEYKRWWKEVYKPKHSGKTPVDVWMGDRKTKPWMPPRTLFSSLLRL